MNDLTVATERAILDKVRRISEQDRKRFFALVHQDGLDVEDAYRKVQRPDTKRLFLERAREAWEEYNHWFNSHGILKEIETEISWGLEVDAVSDLLDLIISLKTEDVKLLLDSDPRYRELLQKVLGDM